ncbi:MAG TPA: molybdopterin-dependent oxidoreductase [Steroidobacteraceae bacterium]|nr:molybdopterin-dependent oxidoreductase [Steroidobacteraceae bacterium]
MPTEPSAASIKTTCPYCGVGCGVKATVTAHEVIINGDDEHPANFGRLCSKGSALGETLNLDGRLLAPQIRDDSGALHETGWDDVLNRVADKFKQVIADHGPDAVAFYVSGQLLTEDYYIANKLMKGFIGSANIDTNSRLCMSSAVAAHKRAFGEDVVPVNYDDLEAAELIVLVGSNTAWCHPIVYQRIVKAKENNPQLKIVVVDPRRTATCDIADLHLPLIAGTDVWLFNGLLSHLHQHKLHDAAFISEHTRGLGKALLVAENTAGSIASVAKTCGVNPSALEEFYALFARHSRVITLFSQGVNQSSQGTDKANAIINCHLLTGRISKPGMGPFSITGQPNAMGGREVGGLANMLAAHMDLEDATHRQLVQTFWESPVIADKPGLKAVDLFKAIHAGKVKAVWIMATNPVVSLPDANKVKAALQKCELVVVSDVVMNTDTNHCAHVLLPAAAWGEKDGTVTNSERRISRQRKFLPLPAQAKPDWWIICEVARRMGFAHGFNFNSAREIFLEHAALSAKDNHGERVFNLDGLTCLSESEFDELQPIQWPVLEKKVGTARVYEEGRYSFADHKARFVPTRPHMPKHARNEEYPLVLNTGRIRDQWHTMTRTGKAARLNTHIPEPFVDMHPQDALLYGVREGELVRVATRWGSMIARLKCSGEVPRRMIFVPIHWNGAYSSDARVGALVNPVVDPASGEPELKHTPARVASFVTAWQGFVLSRQPMVIKDAIWWTQMQGEQFIRHEIAGRRTYSDWSPWARKLLGAEDPRADFLEYFDVGTRVYRAAHIVDDRIESCVFVSPRPDLPSRTWLAGLFSKSKLSDRDRAGILAGRAIDAGADAGATVCSCFGVGRNTICNAIKKDKLSTVQQLGQKLKCGTNCGSCIPELRNILLELSAVETE